MYENIISHHARIRPHAPAIIGPSGSWTFADFDRDITAMHALLGRAASLEGVVGVVIEDVVEHWIVLLALARLGQPSLSLAGSHAAQIAAQASDAKLTWVVSDRPLPLVAMQGVVLGGDWRSEVDGLPVPVPRKLGDKDLVRVTITSGSTGRPKLIGLSRGVLDRRIRNAPMLGPMAGGKLLSLIGVDNWGGFYAPLISWATSGSVLFLGKQADWGGVFADGRPELMIASPLHLAAILKALPHDFHAANELRIVVAGGVLPTGLGRDVRQRLSPDLFICYASTECGFSTYGYVGGFAQTAGGAGYVLPWSEVEIVGEDDGRPLPAGQVGKLRLRGDEAVESYFEGSPADGDFRGGWFYPGDLGSVSHEGFLTIAGREGEVMNCGGVKISPLPIEDILQRCAGVADAAAVSVSRLEGFDEPYAAVVAGAGFDLVRTRAALAGFEHEIRVVVIDAIPRTAGLQKIVRAEVRKKVLSALDAAAYSADVNSDVA